MAIELVKWNIIGVRPLMQGCPKGMERKEGDGLAVKVKKGDSPAFKEAAALLYQNADGHFFHPAIAFWKSLFPVASGRELGRKAASTVIGLTVATLPDDELILCEPDTIIEPTPTPLGPTDWVVDIRGIPVNGSKGRKGTKLIARPKWPRWAGILRMEIDRDFIAKLDPLTELLNLAGRMGVGVGRIKKVEGKYEYGGLHMGKYRATLRK